MKPDAAVPVWLVERYGAVLEQLHHCWPADAEQVRSLLRREEQALGSDERGLALAHHFDRVAQPAMHLRGQRDPLVFWPGEESWLGAGLEEAGQIKQRAEVVRRKDEVVLPVLALRQAQRSGGVGHPRHANHKSKETKAPKQSGPRSGFIFGTRSVNIGIPLASEVWCFPNTG